MPLRRVRIVAAVRLGEGVAAAVGDAVVAARVEFVEVAFAEVLVHLEVFEVGELVEWDRVAPVVEGVAAERGVAGDRVVGPVVVGCLGSSPTAQ